ncbi:hypothetical protein DPMN_035181 [Dreissena polymorpha]|uniref:Uncharacterized protein n=1 Tax=Dreissena polymorpha TaxID=45954 RepID=A0A9D4RKC7_DREPO|nr:hypothetical protein DPMN_035181 [Dreissena polymorpha]
MANLEMCLNRTLKGMASIQRNLHAFENMTELRLHELEQFTENTFKVLVEAHNCVLREDVDSVDLGELQ